MEMFNFVVVLLMAVSSVFIVIKATTDQEAWMKVVFRAGYIIVAIFWISTAIPPSEPWDSNATTTSSEVVTEEGVGEAYNWGETNASTSREPTYSDPRWPTTNPELLAIPEADRWYNSESRVGSYGTIAGPVADVDILDDRVMVNIGVDYPDPDRAQIVIWAERWEDFQNIIDDISVGDNWVSVSGEIGEYDGVPEIDVNDSNTQWRWWTGVR
ncbi:MAG: hypothetical protein ACYCXZ_03845 [Coriobacteriia bacterium]